MSEPERRKNERIQLRIPIRVIGFGGSDGDFTEDTETLVVNQAGARISLKRHIAADDVIRIVNLENHREAEFRVVGPMRFEGGEVLEWGVEYTEVGHDIWGIESPPPLPIDGRDAGAMLECRRCHSQGFWPLTLMEVDVLEITGEITRSCTQCKKTTHWTYADTTRRPQEFAVPEPAEAERPAIEIKQSIERRQFRRIAMKLPILVRKQAGEQEISKTENVSKGGTAAAFTIDLEVGEIVDITCPFTSGGQDIPQRAVVRHRATFPFGGRRLYGFQYSR